MYGEIKDKNDRVLRKEGGKERKGRGWEMRKGVKRR
jgi:hypothetical protein